MISAKEAYKKYIDLIAENHKYKKTIKMIDYEINESANKGKCHVLINFDNYDEYIITKEIIEYLEYYGYTVIHDKFCNYLSLRWEIIN